MDNDDLTKKLQTLGLSALEAKTLIALAENRKISIRRAFFYNVIGIFNVIIAFIVVYIFFMIPLSGEDAIIFNIAYFSIILVFLLATPSLKVFYWSCKTLYLLKGI